MIYDKLVSVIIPAYNVEKYISRGIESVLNQTYKKLELIIVDDGSSDNTFNIAENYSLKDSRIKVISQKNAGVSSARNKALEISSGEYVLFLDSDDWLEIDAIEKLIKLQYENSKTMICCDRYFAFFKDDDNIEIIRQTQSSMTTKVDKITALKETGTGQFNLQSSCYKLFSNDIIKKHAIKFHENLFHGEDGLFTFQYLNNVDGIFYTSEPYWIILERPNSATTGNFNHKWLTSIDSVKIMIGECEYNEVISHLKHYLLVRTCICMRSYLKSNYKSKDDFYYIRKNLIENIDIFKTEKHTLKEKIIFYCYMFLPELILKVVYKKLS